jgi:hypothetical protein
MKRRIPKPRKELTSPVLAPEMGDVVILWAGARRPGGINGVPNYLDGASATVVEILGDGRFRVEVANWDAFHMLPKESRVRVVRLDEMSENLGNPETWRAEVEREEAAGNGG